MADSYIQNLFAERIGGKNYGKDTAIYKFEKIKRAKRAAMSANPGVELIDMGVGEPDEMAPESCVKALSDEASKPENRGYADNGGPEYKTAAEALKKDEAVYAAAAKKYEPKRLDYEAKKDHLAKLKKDAQMTAFPGVRTLVETTVAIEFAES